MYVLAGLRSNKMHENTVFILDLNTYCWKEVEPKGKPPSPRCLASAVAVHHKIYMFGGYQIAKQGTHKCFNGMYVYDTETDTWDHLQTTGQSPDPRKLKIDSLI
jgi:N-acetylneuraminic acid mutarotase